MHIEYEMTGNILVAIISGELDHHSAQKAREDMDRTYEAFLAVNLILDFQGVSFMDSSGIGVVMGRYNKTMEKGGKIYITGCSKYIEKILSMAGVFTIISKDDNIKAAINHINGTIDEQIKMKEI